MYDIVHVCTISHVYIDHHFIIFTYIHRFGIRCPNVTALKDSR